MKLTLAGPGSGKTTDLVSQIEIAASNLKQNREMAIITYTNASVDDIKGKLSNSIVITPNIFIGTIHSFLMHYFIMPHADSLGYNVENVLVVDKLSEKGFEWIDEYMVCPPKLFLYTICCVFCYSKTLYLVPANTFDG